MGCLRSLVPRGGSTPLLCGMVCGAVLGWLCGGLGRISSVSASPPADPAARSGGDAGRILDQMVTTYHDAKSYHDQGLITFRLHTPVGVDEAKLDARVEYQRPNRLRLELQHERLAAILDDNAPHALLVADGKQIFARLEGLSGQVLAIADPARLATPEFYGLPGLDRVLPLGSTGRSVVLDLLTAEKPLQHLDRKSAHLLQPADLEGRTCERVQFATQDGPVTLWIDQKSSVLRRQEFSTAALLKELKPHFVTAVELAADFADATLDAALPPAQFSWKKGDDEQYVGHWIEAPDPAHAPVKVLGQPAPNFSFVNGAGAEGDIRSLKGKITVIDFWATSCIWCIQGMPDVERVRKKYAANDKVRFLALSTDEADVSNDHIAGVLKQLHVELPWSRTKLTEPAQLYQQYGFDGIPALVILGPDGRVQFHQVGLNPKSFEELSSKIDALLEGEDLAKKTVDAWQSEQQQYQRKLNSAGIHPVARPVEPGG